MQLAKQIGTILLIAAIVGFALYINIGPPIG